MSDKPKPLTRAEWEYTKQNGDLLKLYAGHVPLDATLDALFRYRERTEGWYSHGAEVTEYAEVIAEEEGIE